MCRCLNILLVALSFPLATASRAAEPDVAGIEFFEKKIRPVLVQHCYACHAVGAKKVQGGFLLDTRAGLRKGGKTGPALVPGKVNESLLIKALRYEDPEMPPKGKLPLAVIADFEKWVTMGAPDPRETTPIAKKTKTIDFAAARQHWAFRPIPNPNPPPVRDETWPASLLDRFVLAKLEANGMAPSAPADRRTLIRRVYFDLIGLPPTFAEVQAFQNDSSPTAFAKVVDRLLYSPHYGERWGRHWLDVARYSDTKDFVVLKDRGHPYAYTYRDYVIRALNADIPYDRFIHEQLAADMIEPKVTPPALAAMGFLTLGRNFDGNIHDIYDDRIDTVSRGLLGRGIL